MAVDSLIYQKKYQNCFNIGDKNKRRSFQICRETRQTSCVEMEMPSGGKRRATPSLRLQWCMHVQQPAHSPPAVQLVQHHPSPTRYKQPQSTACVLCLLPWWFIDVDVTPEPSPVESYYEQPTHFGGPILMR